MTISSDEIKEVLSKGAPASEWIHDFVNSDNPRFAGKSKEERIKMALGAYYSTQNESLSFHLSGKVKGTSGIYKSKKYNTLEEALELRLKMVESEKFDDISVVNSDGEEVSIETPESDDKTLESELTAESEIVVDQLDSIGEMVENLVDLLDGAEKLPEWVGNNVSGAHEQLSEILVSIETEDSEKENNDEALDESFDEKKFSQLARMGLVDAKHITKYTTAVDRLNRGETPTREQALLLTSLLDVLFGIIAGDETIFNRIKSDVQKKKYGIPTRKPTS